MELENYFIFSLPDDIRIKGTRVGIETVVHDYLEGASPEEIAARYRSLTLEQVYATITYYWHNQREVDAYLARWLADAEAAYQEQERHPSPMRMRLKQLKQSQQHSLKTSICLSKKEITAYD